MPKMGSVVVGDFIELVFQGPDSRLAVHELAAMTLRVPLVAALCQTIT